MAEPLPSRQKLFFTASDNLDALVDFTYRVQRKWLGYECFILNRTALALILAQSMPEDYERLKKRLPAYVQIFCIGGLRRLPDERIAWQEADFLETARECGLAPQPGISQAPRAAAFFESEPASVLGWRCVLEGSPERGKLGYFLHHHHEPRFEVCRCHAPGSDKELCGNRRHGHLFTAD